MISVSAAAALVLIGTVVDLVQLQGATSLHFVPLEVADTLRSGLAAQGFATSFFHQYEGGGAAHDAAKSFLDSHPCRTVSARSGWSAE